ncbi:MAG TPA: glutamate--tRNA ligase [Solirubrobacteraceae bacterium]|nr:glutamate--tRNA ligase [Solirubrobacteraceae bacterium]
MRVRFAPSPTGALHIGGARTALFNWLLARHGAGSLVLRIEDTDRERSTPANVAQILDALRWLELDWDEGPILQSERAERHREALDALLASGHAYRSHAGPEEVKQFKLRHGADRGFRGAERPAHPGEAAPKSAQGAVRLRVPDEGATVVHDAVRGDTRFEHVHLDDPVIARADGSPLYNFAVAIDDLDAAITHVVRGEDHLSNTPKQLLVIEAARAIGLTDDGPLPVYAHLPLLHGPDGKKLSKRHGAASVQELRDSGYLPEAVRNYLALLGWGSGDDQTVLSTPELVERFTLERVSRNPARFDEAKLRWLNGVHLRELDVPELARRLRAYLETADPPAAQAIDRHTDGSGPASPDPAERLRDAVAISREKIQTLADFWPLSGFLFHEPTLDPAARERWLDQKGRELLTQVRTALAQLDTFDEPAVAGALEALVARLAVKPREVYQPLRVAIAGGTISPGIFESVALLGREQTLSRIDRALAA